ncbi:ABC transporter substrate-binding protein [Saccharothrix algeriensis]|uniref:ABC transporter substrate-binding protein n=1 Tax=Saccharothrix algeriensis TaxID=173560 RepID=A0A8T8I2Q4_9PSEU|nr:ABC transporter substrate-binding protein [Saccharothrix algeriensis]MBM7810826.1 multiple sugar transport system substrate-binding protein [Saccharothrix algeriensis]QTR04858.1 ABC transporter substrate-binding protein [Saccharothrix algeriensis]
MGRASACLALLCLVAACAVPVADPARDGRGRITFVDSLDLSAGRQIEQRVAEWNRRASRLEQVNYVPMPTPTDAYRAQLMARAQDLAGARGDVRAQCYDVVTLDVVSTAEFAQAGHLAPLSPAEFATDRFIPAAVQSSTFRGKLWAVPWRADVGVLYYRSDLLREEGHAVPRTWEELERTAEAVAPEHGVHGYIGQLRQYEGLTVNALEAVWAHGGDVDRLDGPGARAGIGMLARGIERGWIPEEALDHDESAGLDAFLRGRALFMRNWPYARAQLDASPLRDRYGVAALPGSGALGGWNAAVSRCSVHQATAREFIRFLTGDAGQRALLEQAGYPPTLRALYRDPELAGRLPHLDVLRDAVERARIRPQSAHYDEVSRVVQRAVHSALRNPESLEAELRRLPADVATAFSGR